jgi:hypothetical protein
MPFFCFFLTTYSMFLHINLDTIRRRHHGAYHELPRENSEYTLGPTLIKLHQEHPFHNIYVLNGPGSFTNLRLGCLIVNTLKDILPETINIFTITKLDFRHTCHLHQAVPQYGVLYIWQRKNAWLYDTATLTYEKKTLAELTQQSDIYREDVTLRESPQKVMIAFSETMCDITFNWKTTSIAFADFPWTETTTISPHYLIQPNISEPKKKMTMT